MTRQVWERTITDAAGNVQTGVQVTVFQSDGATIATIYGQQSGGAALANPFNTGVQTTAKFYADPGRYVIRVVKDGQTKEFWDQDIAGKAVRDDIGTAAYLVATTSTSDNTPGRAARVGDFGLGRGAGHPGAADSADLNDLTTTGLYYSVTGANRPAGAAAGQVWVGGTGGPNNNLFQLYFQDLSATPSMHLRIRNNSVWQGWQSLYNSGNALGTVSFASGLNTGAIIERGSNANGDYAKFADGTMICKGARVGALSTNQYATIANLRSAEYTWFFPAAFLAGTVPSIGGHGGDQSYAGWLGAVGLSSTQCNVVYFTATVSPTAQIYPVAIGRWR